MPLRAGSTWAAASTRFALGRSESLAMWLAALRAAIQEQIGLPPASACTRGGRARTATSNRPATAPPYGGSSVRLVPGAYTTPRRDHARNSSTTASNPRPKARGRRPHSLFSPVRSLRTFCTCTLPTFARTSETARIITSSTSSTRRTTPSTLATLRTPLARHSNASGSRDVRRATHGASGP